MQRIQMRSFSFAGGILAGMVVLALLIMGWAIVASANSAAKPTTEFQCKKEFKRGSKGWVQNRAACIKRLKREKPGISCKHPLESRANADGSRAGDTKDFTVELISKSSGSVEFGEMERVQLKVTLLNPTRVALCPRALIGDLMRGSEVPRGASPIVNYYVSIPSGGGLSPVIAVKRGEILIPHAYARLRK